MLVHFVHPSPFTYGSTFEFDSNGKKAYYHVNDILTLFLLLRLIYICRTLLMNTQFYTNRAERVCNMYGCNANLLFIIKCIMKTYPYTMIFISLGISIVYFGCALRIAESPLTR